MVEVIYQSHEEPAPVERHVVVVIHQKILNGRVKEKAFYYDSEKRDCGGSGPFDFLLEEAMTRAQRFASDNRIPKIIVRSKQP